MLAKVRVESGLTGTLQQISREVVNMYGAARLVIAAQEIHSQRTFLGELRNQRWRALRFRVAGFPSAGGENLSGGFSGRRVLSRRTRGIAGLYLALDGRETSCLRRPQSLSSNCRPRHPFRSLIAISFVFAGEWRGRVFVFEPSWSGDTQEELRFLLDLLHQVGPAVYNVYLLHRLRRRAGAAERARFARELHDGAVQSLIAVEMQVDVLKRQAETTPAVVSGELGRIQGLLREEVLKLRELMQQMKSIDVDSRRFSECGDGRGRDGLRGRREFPRALSPTSKNWRCRTRSAGSCCGSCRRAWSMCASTAGRGMRWCAWARVPASGA